MLLLMALEQVGQKFDSFLSFFLKRILELLMFYSGKSDFWEESDFADFLLFMKFESYVHVR